ncbi:MAG: GIY-YIG nuclease family protein [Verrucomicrobia bacterium]|nr:GIY-YIG nuclease family protein [Verrucomicrobiota bacterium]MBU1735332.1 GIY-YIG nuclease family protein [Verrucomicrobiota bacterium]MBU1855483.1 GIY-YIG nuclease family protein [Verrucomicrobiota bacterium]
MTEDKFFVYILRSLRQSDKVYVGFTTNIQRRLDEHNAGTQTYFHRYAPWKLITYVVFHDRTTALAFEQYLKSPSGKAFAVKHLLPPVQN